jgi:hypothetical protein
MLGARRGRSWRAENRPAVADDQCRLWRRWLTRLRLLNHPPTGANLRLRFTLRVVDGVFRPPSTCAPKTCKKPRENATRRPPQVDTRRETGGTCQPGIASTQISPLCSQCPSKNVRGANNSRLQPVVATAYPIAIYHRFRQCQRPPPELISTNISPAGPPAR